MFKNLKNLTTHNVSVLTVKKWFLVNVKCMLITKFVQWYLARIVLIHLSGIILFPFKFHHNHVNSPILWSNYCRYGVKIQSINQFVYALRWCFCKKHSCKGRMAFSPKEDNEIIWKKKQLQKWLQTIISISLNVE